MKCTHTHTTISSETFHKFTHFQLLFEHRAPKWKEKCKKTHIFWDFFFSAFLVLLRLFTWKKFKGRWFYPLEQMLRLCENPLFFKFYSSAVFSANKWKKRSRIKKSCPRKIMIDVLQNRWKYIILLLYKE